MQTSRYYLSPTARAVSLALLLGIQPATNATANPSDKAVETIVVTASRMPQQADQLLASVEVITRNEISKIQPKSIADLLRTVAGIDIAQLGGAGQQTSIFTRGTNANHTLILIDGVRVGSATLGLKDVSTIPMTQIERVEIVKGPRASLWGADALGGVINIFTRRLDSGEHQLSAETGSNSYIRGEAMAGIGLGESGSTTLTVSQEDSRGYDVRDDGETDDDGYDRFSIALRGDYLINDNWLIDWVAQLDDGASDYDSFGEDNNQEYKNHMWQMRAHYFAGHLSTNLAISQSRDHATNNIDYYDFFSGDLVKDTSIFETRRNQISWIGQYEVSSELSTSLGADAYRESISSTSDFDEDERDVWAVYGHGLYDNGHWILEASLRYDDVENIDSETTYNASTGYRFTPKLMVAVNVGHAFKAPTFNDLYYPESFGSVGNPDLKSETADSYELILRSQYAGINTTFSLYKTDVDDLIEWICDEDWNCSPENVEKVEIEGGELTLNYTLLSLDHGVALSYVDAVDKATGTQLDRRAHKNASYQLSYGWQDLEVLVQWQYHGERRDAGSRLDDYQLVNLAASYHVDDHWTLRARASNLLDENYQPANGYNPAGDEYYVGVEYMGF